MTAFRMKQGIALLIASRLLTAYIIDVREGVSVVLDVFHGPSQVSELSICPLDLLQEA